MTATVSREAYSKALLHALKFPSRPVFGLLIGHGTGSVEVTDAIPLFHNHILAPMLEIALMQSEIFAKQSGATIVGCYFANERVEDKSTPPAVLQVLKTLQEHGASLVLQVRCSDAQAAVAGGLAVTGSQHQLALQPGAEEFFKANQAKVLSDFDEVLSEPSLDFFNQKLF